MVSILYELHVQALVMILLVKTLKTWFKVYRNAQSRLLPILSFCSVLFCSIMFYSVLYCSVLFCTPLHPTLLYPTHFNSTSFHGVQLHSTFLYSWLLFRQFNSPLFHSTPLPKPHYTTLYYRYICSTALYIFLLEPVNFGGGLLFFSFCTI